MDLNVLLPLERLARHWAVRQRVLALKQLGRKSCPNAFLVPSSRMLFMTHPLWEGMLREDRVGIPPWVSTSKRCFFQMTPSLCPVDSLNRNAA